MQHLSLHRWKVKAMLCFKDSAFTTHDINNFFTQTFETKKNNQKKQNVKGDNAISVTSRSKESRTLVSVKSTNTDTPSKPS